jgi:hypothetical protein
MDTIVIFPAWSDLLECFRYWVKFRIQYSDTTTRQLAEIAADWTKFVRFYDMFAISCTYLEEIAFQMRFLQWQMGLKIPKRLRIDYVVSPRVLYIGRLHYSKLKNFSFARMLVCKIANELYHEDHRDLFQQSYLGKKHQSYNQKLMFLVIRHLIADISHLHQLLAELKN